MHNWLLSKGKRKLIVGAGVLCLCSLVVGFMLWHTTFMLARTAATPRKTLALQIEMGFGDTYRANYWTPVRVTVKNTGAAFKGMLAVHTYAASYAPAMGTDSPWSFEEPITLPAGGQKQVTLYAPDYLAAQMTGGFDATLRDENQQLVAERHSHARNEVKPGEIFLGLLTNPGADFTQLQDTALLNQPGHLSFAPLDAATMPDMETVLENFDIIVLEDFPIKTLSAAQITALRIWINRGGILIEMGGTHWQQTLGALPANLVPVTLNGSGMLSAQSAFMPVRAPTSPEYLAPADTQYAPLTVGLPISSATLHPQSAFSSLETVASSPTTPLMVKAHQGAGLIYYLAFDLASAPLNTWPGSSVLWQSILYQTLNERLLISYTAQNYDSGPGQMLMRGGLLNLVQPDKPQGLWLIGVLLLGYILIIGPLTLCAMRRSKKSTWWWWRAILCCIIICSSFSYSLASYQQKVSLANNSISLLQFNQDGTTAHATTYMGFFTPNPGSFRLHIAGHSLAQPVARSFLDKNSAVNPGDDVTATIVERAHETELTLQNPGLWVLNPIVSEQDITMRGSISAQLTLRNNKMLIGSITNTTSTALSDLYILLPHSFVPIGPLAAGQTRAIGAAIYSDVPDAGKTLANQIAEYNKLPMNFFPSSSNQRPQNERQRHVALLSALTGAGYSYSGCDGSCLTHAIMSKGVIYATGGQVPNPNLKNDYDPLLIPGAPATLIGWTDQQIAGINDAASADTHVPGRHTNFFQLPLNVNMSDPLQVPQEFITGNIVDIQSYDAQAILPGVYTLSTGSVTFDLPVPTGQVKAAGMLVTIPDLLAQPAGPGSGPPTRSSNLKMRLYNWQSSSWDSVRPGQNAFMVSQPAAYMGAMKHMLIQVGSQDQNQIYFGKPSLSQP